MIKKILKSDVLSIGGSGAGVTSAIYASRQGLKVTIVSKGKIGYSGNVIMAGGGFGIDGESGSEILGCEHADKNFTRERMFECLVKESYYLAEQNMVKQYVDESAIVMKDYLQWAKNANCDFIPTKPCGWMSSGFNFAKALLQGVKESENLEILEDVTIVEILTDNNSVTGAIGLDIYTGELILIKAKAIIIGTGGYQPFSFKNTVSDMTGDGPAMAYRAGAELSDMEFLLAFPTALVPHDMRGSIYPFIFEFFMPKLNFKLVDKNGNDLSIPTEIIDLTRGTKLSKLASSYYMGHAIEQGLGGSNGGIFYDYSANTQEEKDESFKSFYKRFNRFHKAGHYKGESIKRVHDMINNDELIEIGLGFEYSMGGIVVNEKMETGVNGLYAAGEATSGLFGACRAGDGLTEMLCQGMRAGLSAAEYCTLTKHIVSDVEKIKKFISKTEGYFHNEGGMNPIELYTSIEKVCDKGFSVIRNEEGLKEALKGILDLKEKFENVTINNKTRTYNNEWIRAIQAENMLICCEAGIRAALSRKESRGCHIRTDYPQVDHDKFLIKYIFTKDKDGMKMKTRKPIMNTMDHPVGTRKNVIEYFLDKELNYSR